jgi:outer membrane lipoprotein carrier protein
MRNTKAQKRKGTKELTNCMILFAIFFSLFIYCLSPIAAAGAESVDDIVNRIKKKYGEIHDIQGSFTQTSYLKDLERTEKYSGNFFIKKPSMFRWKYALPRNEEVIISGTEIWIYKASEKQALKSKFNKSAYSQLPIAMLESLENMKTDYEIKTAGEGVLELVPKEEMGFIKKIHLEIAYGEFPVNTLTIFDMYGNTIILKLKDVKINPGLDNSLFVFKIPQGVEVHDFSQ